MFRRTDLIKELRDTPASFPIQHATSCKKKYPVRSRETLNNSQLLSAHSHLWALKHWSATHTLLQGPVIFISMQLDAFNDCWKQSKSLQPCSHLSYYMHTENNSLGVTVRFNSHSYTVDERTLRHGVNGNIPLKTQAPHRAWSSACKQIDNLVLPPPNCKAQSAIPQWHLQLLYHPLGNP
jgi:hypothetical protein